MPTLAEDAALDRRMCSAERGFWKFGEAAPANAISVARVRGPLDDEQVRRGLAALQARHPFLRARVETDASVWPRFRFGTVGPIPLRVVERPADDVLAEVDNEMNDAFRTAEGPLGRAVLVRHAEDDVSILLTAHHCISDGQSGVIAMRDLLHAVSRLSSGGSPDLPPLRDVFPVNDRLPLHLWGLRGLRLVGELVAGEARLARRHGPLFKLPRHAEAPVQERRFRCTSRVLSSDLTARFLARAKAEKVTVHSGLSAAMILGALTDAGVQQAVRIALGSPVNLRRSLRPPVDDDTLGYYVSMVLFRGGVAPDAPYWDLARAIRRDTARATTRGDAFLMLDLVEGVFRAMGGPASAPLEIGQRWEKAVQSSMNLTSPGRLNLGTDFGPLSVDDFYMSASLSTLGDFGSVASTYVDRLRWTFIWCEPLMTDALAERLVSAVVARLERALTDRS